MCTIYTNVSAIKIVYVLKYICSYTYNIHLCIQELVTVNV